MSWGCDAIILKSSDGHKIPPLFNHSVIGFGQDHTNVSGNDDRIIIHLHLATYQQHLFSGKAWNILQRSKCSASCLVDTGIKESYFVPDVANELNIKLPKAASGYIGPDVKDLAFFDPVFDAQNGKLVSLWWFRHPIGVKIGCHHIIILVRFPLVRMLSSGGVSFQFNTAKSANTINRLGLRGILANNGVGLRMLCLTPQTVYAPARLQL